MSAALEEVRPKKSTHAKNRPVNSRRKTFDTENDAPAQGKKRVMKSTGAARESLEADIIEPVEREVDQAKLDEMRFMNDVLEIVIHESQDPNANPLPAITVNGKTEAFFRGQPKRVKRMFVERLARLKHTRYSQRETVDRDTGVRQYEHIPHTSWLYPFAVLSDPAGERGRQWLEQIKREQQ